MLIVGSQTNQFFDSMIPILASKVQNGTERVIHETDRS